MRNRKRLKKWNPEIAHRRTGALIYFDFVLNGSRLDGIEKKSRIAFFRIGPEHYHALTEATTKPHWDDTDFTHWSFASNDQISRSEFGATTPLLEVCFVCIASSAEIKATIPDVLTAKNKRTTVSPHRCRVWAISNLRAQGGEAFRLPITNHASVGWVSGFFA